MPAPAVDKSRYAIKGRRAGETYITAFGTVATHPIDGGARLSDKQKKYFEENYGLVKVADDAPDAVPEPVSRAAEARMSENRAAAEAQASEEQRVIAAQNGKTPPAQTLAADVVTPGKPPVE